MKEFLKTYAIFFIFEIAFNLFGGYLLFDLNHFFPVLCRDCVGFDDRISYVVQHGGQSRYA